jgi:hypothetical protein
LTDFHGDEAKINFKMDDSNFFLRIVGFENLSFFESAILKKKIQEFFFVLHSQSKFFGRKKNLVEKNYCQKKYWPKYWLPHPQGHATIHTAVFEKIKCNIQTSNFQQGQLVYWLASLQARGPWFDPWWREFSFKFQQLSK